jgi:alpha-beta hydrolase superfamily lysophospholipase
VVFAVARQPSRRSRNLVIVILGFVAAVLALAAWTQSSKPDLSPWHTVTLGGEFKARDARDGYDWSRYLALEDELFRELEDKVVRNSDGHAEPSWNRYADGGINNPAGFPRNWNRSFELQGAPGEGGAVLIHGLTDSPYSLRRTAEILRSQGVHVVGLRLPGHGTTPSALRRAEVEDWRAAVRIACEHLQRVVGPSDDLILVGYSNGAALAIDFVLDSLLDEDLRTPDRLILYSPAIGITRAAALARAHRVVSFMPWFNKLAWSGIEPEYDPFKYNSFPTDAGYQTHNLTRSVRRRLVELEQQGAAEKFPPVLAFMSLADATVLVEAVVDGLFDRLDRPENELVIFDINRQARMRDFFRTDPAVRLRSLMERPTTPYRLTVISNIDETTDALEEWSRPAGAAEAGVTNLELQWPRGFYSLSHVAVPFPPDDPIYGTHPDPETLFGLQLGTLEPRGERGLLALSADQLTRLRSNPFFSYIERRLVEIVD